MSESSRTLPGPPLGRHVAAVGLTGALMLFFLWLDGLELPLSQAVPADTSVVLLSLILALGAAARFVPRLRRVVPWGRELGIAMFVTAGLHVVILTTPELDVVGLFGEVILPDTVLPSAWAGANWIGALALAYTLVLAAISNDCSQRKLRRGWKFIQRQAYSLFVLVWIHTAAFVLLGTGHGHLLSVSLFLAVTGAAVVFQFAGFVHTVRAARGPSPSLRVTVHDSESPGVFSARAIRWFGVVVLWSGFVFGSWFLATVPSAEDRQMAFLCERYDQLSGLPLAEIQDELMEVAPEDVGPGAPLSEWLELCEDV